MTDYEDEQELLYDYNNLEDSDCNCEGQSDNKRTLVMVTFWEYLRDLLLNAKYCPNIICWANKEERMFHIVKPEEIASLWGLKRVNHPMGIIELIGLLRFYIKKRIIFPVIQSDFVYRFNPEIVDVTMPTPNRRLNISLRNYYKKKILLPVLGKRLVYKFGPHGVEWRKNTQNCKK